VPIQNKSRYPETICPGLMFEMLRSFLAVARSLNLSHAVSQLGSTRQTVRRHIETLQELRGERLFDIVDRQYVLTEKGIDALPEAERMLELANAWLRWETWILDGLSSVRFESDAEVPYYSQQHPLDMIWTLGTPLVQTGLSSWIGAQARLESSELDAVREYLVAYRRHRNDWLCVSIGEQSSYATWLGWSWAKSAIGKPLQDDPMASPADRYVDRAYTRILQAGGVRLDHVYTRIARQHGGPPLPISYQRLLMRCSFPNGEHALVTLIDRTPGIRIVGLPADDLDPMSTDLVMQYPVA
jgi:hypothetical protein